MCSIRASRGAGTVLGRARVRAGVAVPPHYVMFYLASPAARLIVAAMMTVPSK